ncbi:hypothetical protein CapIbe_006133 [Capra ibex]
MAQPLARLLGQSLVLRACSVTWKWTSGTATLALPSVPRPPWGVLASGTWEGVCVKAREWKQSGCCGQAWETHYGFCTCSKRWFAVPPSSSRAACTRARSSPRPPAPCGPQFPRGPMQPCSRSGFHRGPILCLGAPHLSALSTPPATRTAHTYLVVAATAAAAATVTPNRARPVASPRPPSPQPRDPRLRRCRRGSERSGPPPGGNGRVHSGRAGDLGPRRGQRTPDCFRKEPNVLPRDWRGTWGERGQRQPIISGNSRTQSDQMNHSQAGPG